MERKGKVCEGEQQRRPNGRSTSTDVNASDKRRRVREGFEPEHEIIAPVFGRGARDTGVSDEKAQVGSAAGGQTTLNKCRGSSLGEAAAAAVGHSSETRLLLSASSVSAKKDSGPVNVAAPLVPPSIASSVPANREEEPLSMEPQAKQTRGRQQGASGKRHEMEGMPPALGMTQLWEEVALDRGDCTIGLNIEENGLVAWDLHDGPFGFCWEGVRANLGIAARVAVANSASASCHHQFAATTSPASTTATTAAAAGAATAAADADADDDAAPHPPAADSSLASKEESKFVVGKRQQAQGAPQATEEYSRKKQKLEDGKEEHHEGRSTQISALSSSGPFCFGVTISELLPVSLPPLVSPSARSLPPSPSHVCRIGVSRGDTPVGALGEVCHSFGYGGTGKASTANSFRDFGSSFSVGDVITCAVDMTAASIGFAVNGQWQGEAFRFDPLDSRLISPDRTSQDLPSVHINNVQPSLPSSFASSSSSSLWCHALFPHVLLKNVKVHLHFSTSDGLLLPGGCRPWEQLRATATESDVAPNALEHVGRVGSQELAVVGVWGAGVFERRLQLPKQQRQQQQYRHEVLMMVGLPGCGKTTWAERRQQQERQKRYVILGTDVVLDSMKVPGMHRKFNYSQRWESLMPHASEIFNALLQRAPQFPRNFILDQTNVYANARRRKLRPFEGFRKVAVVLVPTLMELRQRTELRTRDTGKAVPQESVDEMTRNFVLPHAKFERGSSDPFDEVWFEEERRQRSEDIIREMKQDAKMRELSRKQSSQSGGNMQVAPQDVHSTRPYSMLQSTPRPQSWYPSPSPNLAAVFAHGPSLPAALPPVMLPSTPPTPSGIMLQPFVLPQGSPQVAADWPSQPLHTGGFHCEQVVNPSARGQLPSSFVPPSSHNNLAFNSSPSSWPLTFGGHHGATPSLAPRGPWKGPVWRK